MRVEDIKAGHIYKGHSRTSGWCERIVTRVIGDDETALVEFVTPTENGYAEKMARPVVVFAQWATEGRVAPDAVRLSAMDAALKDPVQSSRCVNVMRYVAALIAGCILFRLSGLDPANAGGAVPPYWTAYFMVFLLLYVPMLCGRMARRERGAGCRSGACAR